MLGYGGEVNMVDCDICKQPAKFKWIFPLIKFGKKVDVGYCDTHYAEGIAFGWLEAEDMVRI